jgi:ribosomal protein S18 acetylase RimI-like enzyme
MSADVIPVARAFEGEDDLAKLVVMLRASVTRDRDDEAVSIEDLRFEWIDDEEGWVRNLQVWEVGNQFVAAFGAWHEPSDQVNRAYGSVFSHPDWREPVFIDEVIRASHLAVSGLIERPVKYRVGLVDTQDWLKGGLERAGYTVDQYYHRMSAPVVRKLPEPQLPDGFKIRPFAGESEIEEWVTVFNHGFAGSQDPVTTSVAEKRHRLAEAGYLPAADLVLVDSDNRIVGIGRNSSEKMDDDSERGWVNSVALLPEYRGRGLGRALLLTSMAALKAAGFKRVYLHVSTDKTGAQQLYLSAGFTTNRLEIVYVRGIDPVGSTT